MSIQGNINQLIGMAGLFSQLPSGQALAEKGRLGRQDKILQKMGEEAGKAPQADVEGTIANRVSEDISKQREDVAKRQFELNPSKSTYSKYSMLRSTNRQEPLAISKITPEEAMEEMIQSGMTQLKQRQTRRNFMNYLKNEPTNLGGSVGDLSKKVQKQIASQYSKGERKALMDRVDEENK